MSAHHSHPFRPFFMRAKPAALTPDPADMGTAFGLEASLDQQPTDADESQLEADQAAPAKPETGGWLGRLRRMGGA